MKTLILLIASLLVTQTAFSQNMICKDFAEKTALGVANFDIQGIEEAACDGEPDCLGQQASLNSITFRSQTSIGNTVQEKYTVVVFGFHGRQATYEITVDSTDISFCETNTISRNR